MNPSPAYSKLRTKPPLTWQQIAKHDPNLDMLLTRAKNIKDDRRKPSFCANAVWYGHIQHPKAPAGGFKSWVCSTVGWEVRKPVKHPVMKTAEAYDLAYDTIYEALPNCRNCSCL